MDRENQIEEMASDLNDCITEFVTDTGDVYIDDEATAQKMFDKGYRKIVKTDWLTKGISKEQLEKEKDESLKEFFDGNCKKYGYRKQSEVAREIFDEIERILSLNYCCCLPQGATEHYEYYEGNIAKDIAELKKKYVEESGNVE